MTLEHGKYRFCIYLTFKNHAEEVRIQRGGFERKTDAVKAKEVIINQLYNNTFIPWDFCASDFYDYWLYHVRTDLKYNSFMAYRNIIYNYLLVDIGKMKLSRINHNVLLNVATRLKQSDALYRMFKGVMYSSFKYMITNNLIKYNPLPAMFRIVDAQEKKQISKYSIGATYYKPQRCYKVLSAEQVAYLLYSCKKYEFSQDIFMPLLFTICTGVRISEAFAIKFKDVDFTEKTLKVGRQLGRLIDGSKRTKSSIVSQEIEPKSSNGTRTIPLCEFVLDEIILAKKRYMEKKANCVDFHDYDYITCNPDGTGCIVKYAYEAYNKLFQECGLEKVKWHDLRHTYASLLHNNALINLKAISSFMGHSKPKFTLDVYIYEEEEIYDISKEMSNISSDMEVGNTEIKTINEENVISDKILLDIFS